jgi:subtilisin family serine protease
LSRAKNLVAAAVVLAVCCSGPDLSAQQPQGRAKAKISPDDQFVIGMILRSGDPTTQDSFVASYREGPKRYAVLNVEFKTPKACADFQAKGAYVFSRFEEFADIFVDSPAGVAALLNQPDVVWIDAAGTAVAPPPVPGMLGEKNRDLPEPVVRGGVGNLKGQGVIIAVIDSGLDFHHPDFIRSDADGRPTSRLLYFWDTMSDGPSKGGPGSPAPVSYPNGASVGTVYSQDDLTAELRSQARRIPVWDTSGHGTACASVAAGNGNAADKERRKDHIGVAPEADLIAVRIGGAGRGLQNAYLLNSICDWINKIAGDKPVVISCSFGGNCGGHDGSRVTERRLGKRFPATAKGRAICIAAGNDGDTMLHAEVEFGGADSKGELTWVSSDFGLMVVYCDADEPGDLVISGVNPKAVQVYYHPLTRAVVCEVDVGRSQVNRETGAVEPDRLQLASKSGKRVKADAYLHKVAPRSYFTGNCAKYGKQISSPACAVSAITVGSYDFNSRFHRRGDLFDYDVVSGTNDGRRLAPLRVGGLSAFSNPGPSRDGKTIKPDLAAPGQWWTAASPSNVDAYRDTSGRYELFNGTSAATPYTAGIVALMMQKKPSLTLGEIKELLHGHVSKDYADARDNGKPESNSGWGYGKLDKKAVEKILNEIR